MLKLLAKIVHGERNGNDCEKNHQNIAAMGLKQVLLFSAYANFDYLCSFER